MDDGKEYRYHEPVQTPINPPYSEACLLKKLDQLAKPDLGACSTVMSKCDTQDGDGVKLPDSVSDTASTVLPVRRDDTTEDSTVTVDDDCL